MKFQLLILATLLALCLGMSWSGGRLNTTGSGGGGSSGDAAAFFVDANGFYCDDEGSTPADVAWIADDGGTTNTGTFADPFDYNEELLGINAAANANWKDLWDLGYRRTCWKNVASNYELIDNTADATLWNQGPLLSTNPTQGLQNFSHHPAPLNVGSEAAFDTATLLAGIGGLGGDSFQVSDSRARAIGEWYGFRCGDVATSDSCSLRGHSSATSTKYDETPRYEYNYFASSSDSELAESPGNDTSINLSGSDGAIVRFNYFAKILTTQVRTNPNYAAIRSFYAINMDVSNNTFAICPANDETGWNFIYPKHDDENVYFGRNVMYSLLCNTGQVMTPIQMQGSGEPKDADIGLWERNVFWNQTDKAFKGSFGRFQLAADDQTLRYNLGYDLDWFVINGESDGRSCDGTNSDWRQNANMKVDNNILIDVTTQIFFWWEHLTNQPATINDNAIWFVDESLSTYVAESTRGAACVDDGGAVTRLVTANVPTASAGIANLNGLSYASGNDDSDPRLVCQYIGDNTCDGGTVGNPDDFRLCTGVGTPVAGCPGASPFVDGSGIAQVGPYQGEDMDDEVSTYTVQLGAGWLPPLADR